MAIIELKNITKTFEQDGKIFDAVKDASVRLKKARFMELSVLAGQGSRLWCGRLTFLEDRLLDK